MFWTLRVAPASTSYFCWTTSSSGSTANVGVTERAHRTHEQNRRLLISQRHHRIDFHGASRGNIAGERGGNDEKTDDAGVGHDIGCLDAVKHACKKTRQRNRSDDAQHDTSQDERKTL